MNRPNPTVPTVRREERSRVYLDRLMSAALPIYGKLCMAYDAGYEAGAEDAGSGELLAEALDLRYSLYDLDGKTKRAVALDDLVMAVQVDTIEHEEDCLCGLCTALGLSVDESGRWLAGPSNDARAENDETITSRAEMVQYRRPRSAGPVR